MGVFRVNGAFLPMWIINIFSKHRFVEKSNLFLISRKNGKHYYYFFFAEGEPGRAEKMSDISNNII